MYAKLDKLRADLQKAIMKRDAAEKKVKYLEEKLREEENQQIVSDVASYNLSPEQLAQFLQLAGNGKLQEMLNGKVSVPGMTQTLPDGHKTEAEEKSEEQSGDMSR